MPRSLSVHRLNRSVNERICRKYIWFISCLNTRIHFGRYKSDCFVLDLHQTVLPPAHTLRVGLGELRDKMPSDSITTGFCYRLVCFLCREKKIKKYSTFIDSCADKKTASTFDGSCRKLSTCTFIWFSVWVKDRKSVV